MTYYSDQTLEEIKEKQKITSSFAKKLKNKIKEGDFFVLRFKQHEFKAAWRQLNHCSVTVNSVTAIRPRSHNPLAAPLILLNPPFSAPLIPPRRRPSFPPSSPPYSRASLTFTWSTHIFPCFSMLLSACQCGWIYGPHPSASHARIYGWWSPNVMALNQSSWSRPLGCCGI